MSDSPTPARPALDAMAEEIDTLLKSATPGKWVWQTGSSWTRLGTETGRRTDGSVICPFVNQYDRHPDLSVRTADAELIVTLVNNAPALVAALRSLADMRGALEKIATKDTLYAEMPEIAKAALARRAP